MSLAIDVLIVLVLLGCVVHGSRRGVVGSVGSIAGFAGGAVAARLVAPAVGALVADPTGRLALGLAAALVLLLLGVAVGARLGTALGRPLRRTPLGPVDRVLGAALQLAAGALVVTVLASTAVALGGPAVSRPVAGSAVVPWIAAHTPAGLDRPLSQARDSAISAGTEVVRLGTRLGVGEPATRS